MRTRDQILWALGDAEADEAIGCVLIRGAGRAFSAGGDLAGNACRETPFEHNQFLERVERFHDRIRGATVPVVAAVHGYCLGVATQLVAACDFVVAADTARLGFPEGRMGLAGVIVGHDRRAAVGKVPDRDGVVDLRVPGEEDWLGPQRGA